MKKDKTKKNQLKIKRACRVRKKLHGTEKKPRLTVNKTNQHIYVQLIDDESHNTVGSCSTLPKSAKKSEFGKKSKEAAKKLGEHIAQIANEKNIQEVVFDRGPHCYHGILAELADAAREKGLKF